MRGQTADCNRRVIVMAMVGGRLALEWRDGATD